MYFGTLVWQVLEEGRLSTCKLYVYMIYIIYIESTTLCMILIYFSVPIPPFLIHEFLFIYYL